MQTFRQFILSEGHLPYLNSLIDFLTKTNYIQKIINIGQQIKNIDSKYAHVGAISHFNPYTKKDEVIDVYLELRQSNNLGYTSKSKRKTAHGKDYWFVVLNWFVIMETQISTNMPLEDIVRGRLYHEMTHAVDPSPKNIKTTNNKEINGNDDEELYTYFTNQGEVNARITDMVHVIKKLLTDKIINLVDLKNNLRKPKTSLVFWLSSINPLATESLQFYMKNRPDIIQKIRQVIYNEIFDPQLRDIPQPRRINSKFHF